MFSIEIAIHNKDRMIAAMVKALSFEVDGPKSVGGASKEFLKKNGYLKLHFSTQDKATEFKEAISTYLPQLFARVQ